MKVEATPLEGLFVVEPKVFKDERGYFLESYHQKKWSELLGEDICFVQDNEAQSSQGVIRGLHFQAPPHAQAKLVKVLVGEILDVAVDIRKKSPTYGHMFSILLSSDNHKQLFIPEGFAHGYSVLSSMALVQYKVNRHYHPASEQVIFPLDEKLNIDWQLGEAQRVVSQKDKDGNHWLNFVSPF